LSAAVLQFFFTPFLPLAHPVPLLQSDWQNHLKQKSKAVKKICTYLVLTVDNGTLRRHAVVMS